MYLNVDLGEEIMLNFGIEKEVMAYIDACNIACGGHAGSAKSVDQIIAMALRNHIPYIGAHPSFPDKPNFGRAVMTMALEDLKLSLLRQLELFQKYIQTHGASWHHIKFHGALYHLCAHRPQYAELAISVLSHFNADIILFAPPNSYLSTHALQKGIKIHHEVFGDRGYHDDLSLVSRENKDALINDSSTLKNQIKHMVISNEILTLSGKLVSVPMDTICLHSDHEGAIEHIISTCKWIRTYRDDTN